MTTLRYTVDPHTLTVIDTATGIRVVCSDLLAMMKLRSELEQAATVLPTMSERKAARMRRIEERKAAGQ